MRACMLSLGLPYANVYVRYLIHMRNICIYVYIYICIFINTPRICISIYMFTRTLYDVHALRTCGFRCVQCTTCRYLHAQKVRCMHTSICRLLHAHNDVLANILVCIFLHARMHALLGASMRQCLCAPFDTYE